MQGLAEKHEMDWESWILCGLNLRDGDVSLNKLAETYQGRATNNEIAGAVWKWLQNRRAE